VRIVVKPRLEVSNKHLLFISSKGKLKKELFGSKTIYFEARSGGGKDKCLHFP